MPRMRRLPPAAAVLALLALAPASSADPTGKSTLRQTVEPAGGTGFVPLERGAGESYVVRRGGSAHAKRRRAHRRRSLAFFAQLTDPQIADEMSPARVDFVDPAGGALKSSHRPQEALGLQTFDAVVRNIDANRRSPVRSRKGRHAKLNFAITTGDLADNQQFNETNWFRTVLDGGRVDPFSGRAIDASNPCSADPAEVARLNADVAARRYIGVQDYDDYRGAPTDRFAGFWDPDEAAPTAGAYAAFPRYPGLLERAQTPFDAKGLDVPWYISRGNHDGLIQGNAPASTDLFRAIAVGCLKVFPNSQIDPAAFAGASESELFARFSDPNFIASLLAGGRRVPPDPNRRIISKSEYRGLMAKGSKSAHGFARTPRSELRESNGSASYYATTPRKGMRLISLDTVAEGGGQNGNLDDPQYRWLKRELNRARRRGQLVVVFGHHTLETMSNATPDEAAGACQPTDEPGCDVDPRSSTPIHLGTTGSATVRSLLARKRNVIAYVAGHTHLNDVEFVDGRRGGGFWQINTASHIDWPQQSRLIQVMDNRDGTLSILGTMLDTAAPQAAPAPANAFSLSLKQLVSLSRTLAYNDPQREGAEGTGGEQEKTGTREDRNVELLVRDPR
jgi:metallophosphoesterase (TIGR03767 family)